MTLSNDLPTVYDKNDFHQYNGLQVNLFGTYKAIIMPSKRPGSGKQPIEYALIVLEDNTEVMLETYNTQEAIRSAEEIKTFNTRNVKVTGEIHIKMPGKGQAPRLPGIKNISEILPI